VSESNLKTAAYYQAACEAQADEMPEVGRPSARRGVDPSAAERLMSKLSLYVGGGLAACVAVAAVGYFVAAGNRVNDRAKESTHPIDWLLWFGGAKDDQTFEKFVNDAIEESQRDFEEQMRSSPAYQEYPQDFDWSRRFQFDPNNSPINGPTAVPPAKRPSRGVQL
jgi:hypothetical protein